MQETVVEVWGLGGYVYVYVHIMFMTMLMLCSTGGWWLVVTLPRGGGEFGGVVGGAGGVPPLQSNGALRVALAHTPTKAHPWSPTIAACSLPLVT